MVDISWLVKLGDANIPILNKELIVIIMNNIGFWHFGISTYHLKLIFICMLVINLNICRSPFCLVMAQSQCLMVIGRDNGFSCQQRMLDTFPCPDYLYS